MRKVTVDEILALGAYEQVRDRFRQRIIAHKRVRRVFVGPEMSLVFEDHDTVLMQVQEMLRAERISAPKAVREEVDVYNDLVPDDGALLGTLMLEIEDAAVREQRDTRLLQPGDVRGVVDDAHRVGLREAHADRVGERVALGGERGIDERVGHAQTSASTVGWIRPVVSFRRWPERPER